MVGWWKWRTFGWRDCIAHVCVGARVKLALIVCDGSEQGNRVYFCAL